MARTANVNGTVDTEEKTHATVNTQISVGFQKLIKEAAEARDLSISDFLRSVLAEAIGYDLANEPERDRTPVMARVQAKHQRQIDVLMQLLAAANPELAEEARKQLAS